MLRIPNLYDFVVPTFPQWPIHGLLFLIFLIALGALLVGTRRLRISEVWSSNLLQNGRHVNEILHAVGQMMFPIKATIATALILQITLEFNLVGQLPKTLNQIATLFIFAAFIRIIHLEQRLIQKLRKIEPKRLQTGTLFVRVFLGQILIGIGSICLALLALSFRRELFPLGEWDTFYFRIVEFIFSMALIQIFISPFVLRIMLPSHSPRTPEEIQTAQIIYEAFKRLDLRQPQVRILDLNQFKTYNALISGFNFAPAWFRQSVMISQDHSVPLTQDETRAVIHHELAHAVLWHIPVRVLSSMALWLLCILPVFAASLFISRPDVASAFTTLTFPFILVGLLPFLLGKIVREQEFQADEFAVCRMGSSSEDLISALSKLTLANGQLLDRHPAGNWLNAVAAHPTVIEREARLQQLSVNSSFRRRVDLSRLRALLTFIQSNPGRSLIGSNLLLVAIWAGAKLNVASPGRDPASTTQATIESRLDELKDRRFEFKDIQTFGLGTLENDSN